MKYVYDTLCTIYTTCYMDYVDHYKSPLVEFNRKYNDRYAIGTSGIKTAFFLSKLTPMKLKSDNNIIYEFTSLVNDNYIGPNKGEIIDEVKHRKLIRQYIMSENLRESLK